MKRLARVALASLSLASVSLALPALAHAADAYVTGNVNLRAGPDPGYPLIDQIPAGTEVNVQGCTNGWEWCDVIVYGNRGWIAGNYVEYEYQDQPVLLPAYGAQIGIPIISFVIGSYWDNYYRGRPFYSQREQWYHRPMVRRPPPPPIRHPYRPSVHGAPASARPPANRPYPRSTPRPMQPRPAQPAQPPVFRQNGHATPRPAQPDRLRQPAYPAAQNHAPMNHPAQTAGHAAPARSNKGRSTQSDHRKDEHQDH